ncbi:MAG: PTS mannitol transporter subunit IICBA [Mycoplasmatales bacterium]|nr:PTS mannitol transporter subunit IICBA [Mycoplasmatales bacterium]
MNLSINRKSAKVLIQKIGTSLSGMIMPIIGVMIAWGLATAFFIPTGWTPVSSIDKYIVGPVIKYLIPILIGFLGGKQIYGDRGGYMGALASAGIIGGADLFASGFWSVSENLGPQFLGAMISGPLFAFIFKKIEMNWEGKVKPGFEMLVNNFSFGIFGLGALVFSLFITPFAVYGLTWTLGSIVDPLANYNALPVTSIFVEPAKTLFLNNAINHGVFTPLGILQVQETGKSILFYIESNPGPGFGLLLAYMLMDKKQRGSAGSASVIHFFGGIHEVYFPFIIMRPILILATIAGGATGVAILQIFDAGAVAPASPGSVIALFAESAKGAKDYIGLALSIGLATVVSFVVAVFLLKYTTKKNISKNEAIAIMNAKKGKKSKYVSEESTLNTSKIKSIIFACDAGMGSSVMGAGILRNLIKKEGLDVKVKNVAIRDLSKENPDLVVVQSSLAERAKTENATSQFLVNNFLDSVQYESLIKQLKSTNDKKLEIEEENETKIGSLIDMVNENNVQFNSRVRTIKGAIEASGKLLLNNNFIEKEYIESMHKRNEDVSVYIGNGVAIPHGQSGSSKWIKNQGIAIIAHPKGLDWNGETVHLIISIAVNDGNHIDLLTELAIKLENKNLVKEMSKLNSLEELKEYLA